jgi:hypothetical protein
LKCEFSLLHYKEIIETARDKGYIITPIRKYTDSNVKQILLRHDVDFSLEFAYDLANIEYDLGVESSYYVLLHAETFNVLAPKSMGIIETMSKIHEVGLHYDSRYSLSHEVDILSSIARKPITSYTQHVPTLSSKEVYQGLINPNELDFTYISDSGRNWREGCICQHIGKQKKLHVSMHPEWWVTNSKNREDMIHQLQMQQLNKANKNITEIKQMLYEYYRDDLQLGGIKV